MVAGAAVRIRDRAFLIVHPHVLPAVLFPVLSNRADLDAAPARGEIPPVQFLRTGGTGSLVREFLRVPAPGTASTGQMLTHRPHRMQSGSSGTGSAGSSAVVRIEANLTRGPYCGVRSMLLSPKFPRPAQYAACRWEKNAIGFSLRISIEPYPSRGTQTDG